MVDRLARALMLARGRRWHAALGKHSVQLGQAERAARQRVRCGSLVVDAIWWWTRFCQKVQCSAVHTRCFSKDPFYCFRRRGKTEKNKVMAYPGMQFIVCGVQFYCAMIMANISTARGHAVQSGPACSLRVRGICWCMFFMYILVPYLMCV